MSLQMRTLVAGVALTLAARAALAAEGDDYAWLNLTNLPPATEMLQAAIKALPKSIVEQKDWLARMRKAALMPNLELHYTIGETIVRDYNVVDRTEVTTGSESSSERSRESGTRLSSGSSSSSETGSDGLTTETRSGSGSEASVESYSSSGSRSSSSSYRQTTYSGPDSYATGESTKWVDEYGLFLTWDLSRMIFQPEELNVASAEMDRENFRQNVRLQVIQTYYDLKESLLLLQSETYSASIPTRVRKERLAFLMDTLTGSALSSRKPGAPAPEPPPPPQPAPARAP